MVNWPQELQITNLVPTSSLRHKKVTPSISRKVSQFISVLHVKARCQRRLKEQFFSGSSTSATLFSYRNQSLDIVISYNATKNLKWTNETGCLLLAQNVTCKASPYRTIDGFCNNIDNPRWGTAVKPFRRALPPVYADGKDSSKSLG